jgi:hypothetical protein
MLGLTDQLAVTVLDGRFERNARTYRGAPSILNFGLRIGSKTCPTRTAVASFVSALRAQLSKRSIRSQLAADEARSRPSEIAQHQPERV